MDRSFICSGLVIACALSMNGARAEAPTPLARADVKAGTRSAEAAGQLVPAGQGPQFTVPRTSQKTRAQRKAETLAARKAGTLAPAGAAASWRADREIAARKSTVDRATRKAETRAAERAGTLTPAGQGPDAPRIYRNRRPSGNQLVS